MYIVHFFDDRYLANGHVTDDPALATRYPTPGAAHDAIMAANLTFRDRFTALATTSVTPSTPQ